MTLANQDNNLIIESLMKIIERYSSDETNVIKSIKPDFINKIEKLLTQKNITLAISGESASGIISHSCRNSAKITSSPLSQGITTSTTYQKKSNNTEVLMLSSTQDTTLMPLRAFN